MTTTTRQSLINLFNSKNISVKVSTKGIVNIWNGFTKNYECVISPKNDKKQFEIFCNYLIQNNSNVIYSKHFLGYGAEFKSENNTIYIKVNYQGKSYIVVY
jgi:hypothetical protein